MIAKDLFRKLKAFITSEKEFFRNVSFVFGGKSIIAIIALVTTPILTRLYAPEAYGTFALYYSVVQSLVVLGTFALPAALNTAKKEAIIQILKLTFICITLSTIVIAITLYFFGVQFGFHELPLRILTTYYYIIPLGFLLSSTANTLSALQLRMKEFKLTTKVNITEAFSAKTINLINGLLNMGGLGLIISDLLSKLLGIIILIINFPSQLKQSYRLSWTEFKSIIRLIKNYPLFVMPAQWAGILSMQLILWFIAYKFSAHQLGIYSVALSLLNIPLHILSNSFQPVITQRLVTARDVNNDEFSMNKLLGLLMVISFLVFVGLYLIPSSWFTYYLGNQWLGIGIFIKILCWWHLVLFIDQSINNAFLVFDKQRQKLYFNLVDLALQVSTLAIASLISIELNLFIALFVLVKVVASVVRVEYIRRVVRKMI